MGKVQFIQPKLRLTSQLKEAGGQTVAESVEAAQQNLKLLRPRAINALQQAAIDAQECFDRFPASFSAEALQELYGVTSRAVGAGVLSGARGADMALVSLCSLIDHLSERRRWDLEPIAVHVRTLHLIGLGVQQGLDPAAIDQIVSGLRKVSARYA